MKRFRVLMMMTALLGSAATAHAQEPQDYPPPPAYGLPGVSEALKQAPQPIYNEAELDAPSWCDQLAEQTVAAWQRLRELCQTRLGQSIGYSMGSCEMQAKPGVCKGAAGCAVGAAGCGKDIHLHVQVQATPAGGVCQLPCGVVGQKADACDCAKGCGCCDKCKAKAAQAALPPKPPMACPFGFPGPMVWGMPPQAPMWSCPLPSTAVPSPRWTTGLTPPMPPFPQAMPAPRMVIGVTTSVQQGKPAHLVTPELEAHCQRIIHKDGSIILEGNVLMLCKKHAQPIRIEASRVVVNMKDGSFVVESGGVTVTTTSFSTGKKVAVPMTGPYGVGEPLQVQYGCPPPNVAVPAAPMPGGIIQVIPVPYEGGPR
jgi:hypothetical protein